MCPVTAYCVARLLFLQQRPWKRHILFNLDFENIIFQPWGDTDEKTSCCEFGKHSLKACELDFLSDFSPGWAATTPFFPDFEAVYSI